MDKILHDLKDSKLWELWYIPYYGSCRILSINSNNVRWMRPPALALFVLLVGSLVFLGELLFSSIRGSSSKDPGHRGL